MTIKELIESQKRGVDAVFRRRVVSAYELGFITVEQVVEPPCIVLISLDSSWLKC